MNPEIPEWLVAIIDRLSAKNPDKRFQTANGVANLLSKHLAHTQDPLSTPFPGTVTLSQHRVRDDSRHRGWLVAGLLLIAVLTGVGVTEATGEFTKLMFVKLREDQRIAQMVADGKQPQSS